MRLLEISELIRLSFAQPRVAADRILGYSLAPRELGEIVVLAVLLSTIITQLPSLIIPSDIPIDIDSFADEPQQLSFTPFMALTVNAALMAITVLAVHLVGNLFGGKGTLRGSVLVNAWVHYMMILVQLAVFLLTTILPFLALVAIPVALFLFFWMLSNFVAVLHGFRSAMGVFFAALVLILVFSFGITSVFFALSA